MGFHSRVSRPSTIERLRRWMTTRPPGRVNVTSRNSIAGTGIPIATVLPEALLMPQQSSSNDQTMPNQAANKEQAEGSRENTETGGGITNRPLSEEQENQERVPPRGENKE